MHDVHTKFSENWPNAVRTHSMVVPQSVSQSKRESGFKILFWSINPWQVYRCLVLFIKSECKILIAFWLQHDKYPALHRRIRCSLLTAVLFVKLRSAQNTHSCIRYSRNIQISTHYKRSCLHGCSEDEHNMAIVTSFNIQIRPVLFATVLQDRPIMCGPRIA